MALASPVRRTHLFDSGVSRAELWTQLSGFGLWFVATAIGAFLHPDPIGHGTHQQLGLPPCPSTLFFSRPCPGCGLTTSWSALIHGDLGLAFHAHPLGPPLYACFTLFAFGCAYGFLTGQRLRTYTAAFNRWSLIFVTGFLAFGIVRFALSPNFASPLERQITSIASPRR